MKLDDLGQFLTGKYTAVGCSDGCKATKVIGITPVEGQKPLLLMEKPDGSLGLTELDAGTFFITREACEAAIKAQEQVPAQRPSFDAVLRTLHEVAAQRRENADEASAEATSPAAAGTAAAANETALGELALDAPASTESVDPVTGEITEAAASLVVTGEAREQLGSAPAEAAV